MNFMNLFFKLIIICLLYLLLSVRPIYAGNIVATVNENSITDVDVKKRSDLIIFSSGLTLEPKTYEIIKPKIISVLIDEKLIEQEAAKLKITISDEEIEDAINSLAEKNNMSVAQLEQVFKNKKIDRNELDNQLRYQILLNKIIRIHLSPTINVSSKEINESRIGLHSLSSENRTVTDVKLAEILLSVERKKSLDSQMRIAKQLVKQIKEGGNFAKIAQQFSDSASSAQGGEIGWVPMPHLSPQLVHILWKLKPGEVSEPIASQDGIRIFQVIDRKLASEAPKEFTDDEIRDILMNKKLDAKIRSYLAKMHSKAYIKIIEN